MSLSKGIVVSVWDGIVNFAKAKKAGFVFALCRLGFGAYSSQIDNYYERNCENAKAAGLKVGAYWQTYARNARMARVEAAGCLVVLDNLKEKQLDLPIYIDATNAEIAKAFCDELQAAGCNAAVLKRGEKVLIDGVPVSTTEVKIKTKKTAAKQPADAPVSDEKEQGVN